MRILVVTIFTLLLAIKAFACGLKGETSVQSLLKIAQQTESPPQTGSPQALFSQSSNLIVKDVNAVNVKINENFELKPGMVLSAQTGGAQIYLPSTGQLVELDAGTILKVLKANKSADEKTCDLSFELQAGNATFSSDHQKRQALCKPLQTEAFEVATRSVEITPIGTKYTVDLNQAIAEANGEVYDPEEVSVKKGAVKIRLIKLKKSKVSKKNKVKNQTVAGTTDMNEEKPTVITAGRKAKIKKNKKDRMADIQIVYPEQ